MTALGLLIPAAAAAIIIWRVQSRRPDDGRGLLSGNTLIPLTLVLCGAAFLAFIAFAGTTN